MVFEFKDFRFEQDGRLINVFDPTGKQIVFNADKRTGIINKPIFDAIEASKEMLDIEDNKTKNIKLSNTQLAALGLVGALVLL